MRGRLWAFWWVVVGALVVGCESPPQDPARAEKNHPNDFAAPDANDAAAGDDASQTPTEPVRLEVEHLPNAVRLTEKVISGGLPEGDLAFDELEQLGIKTVISVDGALPDVAMAKQHGMRYVHLPHGYDGIPAGRATELAKAVRDLPGPIYIHCHHGKHRSPAAAAVACVGAGFLQPQDSLAVLKVAGTSENYRGLFESAAEARRIDDDLLDALQAEFPEIAKLPPMAEAMVAIEHAHDHLKALAGSEWKPPADHPDLDPAHEALLLREHFTELLRTDMAKSEPERFQELLRNSEGLAEELETLLRDAAAKKEAAPPAASLVFEQLTKNCTTCHREFRDVPLRTKQQPK